MRCERTNNGVTLELSLEEAEALSFELNSLNYRNGAPSRTYIVKPIATQLKKTVEADQEIAAKAIEEAADRWAKAVGLARIPESARRLHADDAEDLRSIAWDIRRGNFKEAQRQVSWLDTIVRDQIPEIAFPLVGLRKLRR